MSIEFKPKVVTSVSVGLRFLFFILFILTVIYVPLDWCWNNLSTFSSSSSSSRSDWLLLKPAPSNPMDPPIFGTPQAPHSMRGLNRM